MAVQKPIPAPTEVDPDATAELPAPVCAGITDAASTDVYVTPGIPAGVADLAASLRDAEQRLALRMERVTGLEADLADAQRSVMEQRALLEQERLQGAQRERDLRERLVAAGQQLADLRQDLAAREAAQRQQVQDLLDLRGSNQRSLEQLQTWQGFRGVVDAQMIEQQTHFAQLQAQLDAARVAAQEDLRAAEAHIRRLEAEAHDSASLLGNLQLNVERLARDDTGSRPVLRVVPTEHAQRVLIRQVDGVDVEYPLGRRTTIGRTADNDIQVDTTFISRHHAVLLSNPDQCMVEDLDSTNGVKINGRPVNRQALRDGDMLTVGKSEFRYQQRA